MPDVRISISGPPGAIVRVVDGTQPGGEKTWDILVDFSPAAGPLETPDLQDKVAAIVEQIDQRMADELSKPSVMRDRLREHYGIDSSSLSNNDRSKADTSGRDARPSSISRNLVTSRLPSWWLAVMTAPIMSTTVPSALATAFWMASAVKSSICKILSSRLLSNADPKPASHKSTIDSGGRNA